MKRVIDRWKWACTVAAPTLSGTQRAALHVLAAHAPEGKTIVGRATVAESLGISERSVAGVLQSLEQLGVIGLEYRPGKPTITTVNYGWTREVEFPDPPTPRRRRRQAATRELHFPTRSARPGN